MTARFCFTHCLGIPVFVGRGPVGNAVADPFVLAKHEHDGQISVVLSFPRMDRGSRRSRAAAFEKRRVAYTFRSSVSKTTVIMPLSRGALRLAVLFSSLVVVAAIASFLAAGLRGAGSSGSRTAGGRAMSDTGGSLSSRFAGASASGPTPSPPVGAPGVHGHLQAVIPCGVWAGEKHSHAACEGELSACRRVCCNAAIIVGNATATIGRTAVTFDATQRVYDSGKGCSKHHYVEREHVALEAISGFTGDPAFPGPGIGGVLETKLPPSQGAKRICRYVIIKGGSIGSAGSPTGGAGSGSGSSRQATHDEPPCLTLVRLRGSEWDSTPFTCDPASYTRVLAAAHPEWTTRSYCTGTGRGTTSGGTSSSSDSSESSDRDGPVVRASDISHYTLKQAAPCAANEERDHHDGASRATQAIGELPISAATPQPASHGGATDHHDALPLPLAHGASDAAAAASNSADTDTKEDTNEDTKERMPRDMWGLWRGHWRIAIGRAIPPNGSLAAARPALPPWRRRTAGLQCLPRQESSGGPDPGPPRPRQQIEVPSSLVIDRTGIWVRVGATSAPAALPSAPFTSGSPAGVGIGGSGQSLTDAAAPLSRGAAWRSSDGRFEVTAADLLGVGGFLARALADPDAELAYTQPASTGTSDSSSATKIGAVDSESQGTGPEGGIARAGSVGRYFPVVTYSRVVHVAKFKQPGHPAAPCNNSRTDEPQWCVCSTAAASMPVLVLSLLMSRLISDELFTRMLHSSVLICLACCSAWIVLGDSDSSAAGTGRADSAALRLVLLAGGRWSSCTSQCFVGSYADDLSHMEPQWMTHGACMEKLAAHALPPGAPGEIAPAVRQISVVGSFARDVPLAAWEASP